MSLKIERNCFIRWC